MCFVNGKPWKNLFWDVPWLCGREDRALQECNLSALPSVDCGSIRPGTRLGAGIILFQEAFASHGQSVKLKPIHILGQGLPSV